MSTCLNIVPPARSSGQATDDSRFTKGIARHQILASADKPNNPTHNSPPVYPSVSDHKAPVYLRSSIHQYARLANSVDHHLLRRVDPQ